MRKLLFSIVVLLIQIGAAQNKAFKETEVEISPLIKGTLRTPDAVKKPNLVIIIAGSGPTDRNGNQPGMTNNSLRYLGDALAQNHTSVYLYDKRIVVQMANGTVDEKSLRFDDYINDTKAVVSYFREKKQHGKIIIAGHSEGALIAMMAAQDNGADAYISLAGPARPIDEIITDQIAAQAPAMREEVMGYFEKMRKGEPFESNPMLLSVFRESVRPYILSWMQFNPQTEIKKLKIPVLVIGGDKDLQVNPTEAEALKAAKPDAKLVIIENMNHVLKEIKGDTTQNMQSYTDPDLPVMPALVTAVNQFIKTL